jgi:hypothetical protein
VPTFISRLARDPKRAALVAAVICAMATFAGAHAADIDGAWASDQKACDKIFQRKGAVMSLANRASTIGSGFVIDGSSIRGNIANCKIKSKKQDGDLVHLVASCGTDIMLSDVELTLKSLDNDRIARVFAAMPEMEKLYYRCPDISKR